MPMTDSPPSPGRWWTIANGVRVDDRDRERLAQLIYEAVIAEREAILNLVDIDREETVIDYQWGEDRNTVVAQKTLQQVAEAIRARNT